MADDFKSFFKQATGCTPFPYRRHLAAPPDDLPELLQVPTGTGKTDAAVLSSAANPPS
jgi:CRISPR-associated endonuclease/helicase Cas3